MSVEDREDSHVTTPSLARGLAAVSAPLTGLIRSSHALPTALAALGGFVGGVTVLLLLERWTA